MTNQDNNHNNIIDFKDETSEMANMLMDLPRPQLSDDAHQRILNRVQQAIPAVMDEDMLEMAEMLANMPQPQLNNNARQRILNRVQQATPAATSTQATSNKVLRFPVVLALRLTASIAIFIMLLYQIGLPLISNSEFVEKLYPIQRVQELQDEDLISMYFS